MSKRNPYTVPAWLGGVMLSGLILALISDGWVDAVALALIAGALIFGFYQQTKKP